MFVSATTECFGYLPLDQAIGRLADLEFTSIQMPISTRDGHIQPTDLVSTFDDVVDRCRSTRRLDIVAFDVELEATGEEYYEQFDAICRLAKATKVVTLTVPSGPHGTPFNEEVEKLRRLVAIAELQGVRVGMRSQMGRLSEDPDTVVVLCDNVPGLGITLDPSHYICGPHSGKSIEKLMKYVYHMLLRDTSRDSVQVRVGQGEVEYGRLISQLRQHDYNRSLCVDISESADVDHMAELRKMRLLLESLL
ncbi:MAG: sugar phosphate isomerase/epimerase [Pirellulaceae bacterium]|nr:sugar phosphate isomerase/epimerase [Pirellulaceae bacterium]